jgi:outer membrane protein OmpA-like peptidoglycan-associated protein
MTRHLAALVALMLVNPLFAAEGDRRNFVACPLVRDTKTVPCFLAESDGETYFLGIQQDIGAAFYPPQLLHEVLVEGTVASGPRICGGIPLKPLKISVMPEINRACNTILPAEEGIDAPPAPRGAGPSTKRTNLGAPAAPPAPPTAPFDRKDFTILFDFDSDYLMIPSTRVLQEAAVYAKASSAAHVTVNGFRAATKLSNGRDLIENPSIAERRAQKVMEILRGLGLSALSMNAKPDAEQSDGIHDPQNRKVVIAVAP